MSTLPPLVPTLLGLTLSIVWGLDAQAQTLGEGGSAAQGSAGPQGAQNANPQLEKCDAPKGTLAVVEPQSHVIASLQPLRPAVRRPG